MNFQTEPQWIPVPKKQVMKAITDESVRKKPSIKRQRWCFVVLTLMATVALAAGCGGTSRRVAHE